MSRPWNKALRLCVSANRVEAILRSGWFERTAPVAAHRTLEGGAVDPDVALAAAVDDLALDIAARSPLRGAWLDVDLASDCVHLDVVEGDFADRTRRQLQDIASACVGEILGEDAVAHEVRWHLQRDARHLVIVAIASARLALFEAFAKAEGLRLRSVRPDFLLRWNDFGRAVQRGRSVFAVNTSSDLSVAAVVDGAIVSISTSRGVDLGDGARALDTRVDRLIISGGQDPQGQSAFVLVATVPAPGGASARWSVFEPQGVAT